MESKIEARLFRGIKRLGGKALKLSKSPGWPDRAVLLPGKIVVFVELKRPDGRVAEHQAVAHDIIRALGHEIETLWDNSQVDAFLKRCSQRVTSTGTSTS